MADYSLGGGFSSGYGSGGLGLGGGYGGNNSIGGSDTSGMGGGQGLTVGTNSNWGRDPNLTGGVNWGTTGLGLNAGNMGGGYYDSDGNYNIAPGWWGHPAFSQRPSSDYSGGFSPSSYTPAPAPTSYSYTPPVSTGLGFRAPAADTAPAGPPAWSGNVGLQMPSGKTGYGLTGGDDPNPGFWGSDFGRMLRKAGMFALQVHPATRGPMALYGALNSLTSGNIGSGLSGLYGLAGGDNGLIGAGLGIAGDAATGKPTGQRTGSMLGGLFGGAAGGPMGAALGADAGGYIGAGYDAGKTTQAGPTPSQRTQTEGTGYENYMASPEVQAALDASKKAGDKENSNKTVESIIAGLGGLYGLSRVRDAEKRGLADLQRQQSELEAMFAQQAANAPKVAMPHAPAMRSPNLAGVSQKLDAMFGPNSESAQTLRSQLERADAAAGRRSQYGPREVELLARLSQLRAQTEPNYMNAEVSAANAANQHAYSVYAAQMQGATAQAQMRQQELQRAMTARQNMVGNQADINKARLDAEQRRMQQLTTLYGMGRESGFFNYLGGLFN